MLRPVKHLPSKERALLASGTIGPSIPAAVARLEECLREDLRRLSRSMWEFELDMKRVVRGEPIGFVIPPPAPSLAKKLSEMAASREAEERRRQSLRDAEARAHPTSKEPART